MMHAPNQSRIFTYNNILGMLEFVWRLELQFSPDK